MSISDWEYISPPCLVCGKTTRVMLDYVQFQAWRRGTLIQNAFPEMSKEEREVLITGTHGECWKRMFTSKKRR